MKERISLLSSLRRPARTAATWALTLVMLLLLSGCMLPLLPVPGQVDTLPPAEVGGEPIIAVAPNSGAAGDFISVSGAGWPASQTVYVNVETVQDGEKVATTVSVTTADADGRFTASFFLPEEAAQSDTPTLTIVVYGGDPDQQVTAPFTVLTVETPTTPTASPTLTPTATPSPAATVPTATPSQGQPGSTARVVSRGLNMRSGPGAAYAIVRSLSQGDTLLVLGQSRDAYWLYVRAADGTLGWVARPYTNFTGSAPIVDQPIPAPPPPTATRRPTPGATATPVPTDGWRSEYFGNRFLSGSPAVVHTDNAVDFDWGYGAPARGLPSDNFSVRWTRNVYLEGGNYRFIVTSDDGVRVWLDGDLIIDQWREQAATTHTVERSVGAGNHTLRIEYFEGYQLARIRFNWERVGDANAWRGEYFDNRSLSGSPVFVRNDANLDFDWGRGSPDARIPSDNFSVRWTRSLYFDAATYRFRLLVDDGARVFVDDRLVIDEWSDGSVRERTGDIYLGSGNHTVHVEYYERGGDARLRLTWERVNGGGDDTSFPDWKGEYWDNRDLDDSPRFRRNDDEIDFNWGNGSPDSRIPDDNFSVRWTREVDFSRGLYRFYVRSDDGVRLWVDDDRIINEWRENDFSQTFSADRFLDGDTDLRVEYFERNGGARIRVWWERISDEPTPGPVNPFADVNPTSGPAGANLVVTGGGFPANTPVHVYLGALVRSSRSAADQLRYGSGVTDGRGEYRIFFTMPATWPDGTPIQPGDLTVLVATENFGVQASDTFEFQQAPPSPSPKPFVNVNPESGGPETPVTISGGGFPANTRVNAHLARVVNALRGGDNPAVYASATTDAAGNFVMTMVIPRNWQGTDESIDTGKLVVLVATDNFRVQASDTFDLFVNVPRPSINVTPASGGAGTPVTVSGGGFPANLPVSVYLGVFGDQIGRGGAQRYATTVTDGSGNYSMVFGMPATWPDGSPVAQERLIVMVANDDFSVQVSEVFNYVLSSPAPATLSPTPTTTPPVPPTPTPQPALSLAPGSGRAGTIVTAAGSGYPPSAGIALYLAAFDGGGVGGGRNQQYAAGSTDAGGNFALNFSMPGQWPNGDVIDSGRLVVLVATTDFAVQASALFNYVGTTAAGGDQSAEPPTAIPTDTATPAPTDTATPVPTETATPIPTETPAPTDTATVAPTDTATPVPPDTATPVPTETATIVPPTATDTPLPPPDNPLPPPAENITDTNAVGG